MLIKKNISVKLLPTVALLLVEETRDKLVPGKVQ
jgi:hypothetical protein